MFSINRCGLLGLFLQDLLAAVQVTHKLHLSDTKAFHLPLTERINKNVLTLSFLYEFQFKNVCFIHTEAQTSFREQTHCQCQNSKNLLLGLKHTQAYLSASTPSLHPPTSNLFPIYSQPSHRDLAGTCFYITVVQTEQNYKQRIIFFPHITVREEHYSPSRHTPKPSVKTLE